jgi:hypothetical protein
MGKICLGRHCGTTSTGQPRYRPCKVVDAAGKSLAGVAQLDDQYIAIMKLNQKTAPQEDY